MRLKFAANLSFLFQEQGSLLERYAAAKAAGFRAVECAFPYEHSVDEVVKAKDEAGVEQVLINSVPGNLSKDELGTAALPGREDSFLSGIETSIKYAKALNCSRIHIMAGKAPRTFYDAAMNDCYLENLKAATNRFSEENITGLIEPINQASVSYYFLHEFETALGVIKKVDSPNLKLQVDVFHLQKICGNITSHLTEWMPLIGHIQVAQVPDRHEPNSSGEINFRYLFNLLEKLEYDGWIGCEYKPSTSDSAASLSWVEEYGLQL